MSATAETPSCIHGWCRPWSYAARHHHLVLPFAVVIPWLVHAITFAPSEPFFNNDEARHFMTGVFFRDFLTDGDWANPRAYAEAYFLQYPALSLLTWPPFFYSVEGVCFSIFGISLTVAKLLIGAHATLAAVLHLPSRAPHPRRMDRPPCSAPLVVVPLVFEFSRYVMLEMPTLAYSMAATYHFVRHLETSSRRHLLAGALLASFAALTRFDGFFVLLASL